MRNVVVGGTLLVLLLSGCGYIKGAAGGSLESDEPTDPAPVLSPQNKILISEGDSSTPGMAVSKLYAYDVETGVKNYLMDANQGFHVGLMATGTDQNPYGLAKEIGSGAYFYWDDAVSGRGAWKTDFTQAGTKFIYDVSESDLNLQMHEFDGMLLFGDWQGNFICGLCAKIARLYTYDPETEVVENVVTASSGNSSVLSRIFIFDQFFSSFHQSLAPISMIYSDGVSPEVDHPALFSAETSHYQKMGQFIFGWGDDGLGLEPSLINPVTGALHNVLDVTMGAADSQPGPAVVVSENLAFFIANGNRLYMTDGTAGNAYQQYNLGGNGITDVQEMFLVNGNLVMWACDNNSVTGCELWKTSGDLASTSPISDFGAGVLDGEISLLVPLDEDKLIAFVKEPGGLFEPWVSDGTVGGTIKLVSFIGDETFGDQVQIKNGKLYFTTIDSVTQENFLWRTDGTILGTERLFSLGMMP